jgi:hypothetical protein
MVECTVTFPSDPLSGRRAGFFGAAESIAVSERKEVFVHEPYEQLVATTGVQSVQSLNLCSGQAQPWHLPELAAQRSSDSIQRFAAHGLSCDVSEIAQEQWMCL